MTRIPLTLAGLGLAFALAACGGDGGGDSTPANNTPVAAAKTDVTPCLNQLIAGRKLSDLVVPDVITMDLTKPSGFPNGRTFTDPVVDLTLAAIFLDVTKVPVDTLAKLPLDPSGNDVAYPTTFPYFAPAQGTAPTPIPGSNFAFRSNDASAYTRVDRMGEPAVATALIATSKKTAYNDDSPTQDAAGKWVPTIVEDLTGLTDALRDDFTAKNLPLCAVSK